MTHMASSRARYKRFEHIVGLLLITAFLLFIAFLIASGLGITWLKLLCSIVAILISGLCLVFLILTRELLSRRSLWMSVLSAAMILCIVFSLLLNYPSPSPYRQEPGTTSAVTDSGQCTAD